MWSLLFYYALLNAACLMVLLVISSDPPVWDEEDTVPDSLTAAPPLASESPSTPARQAQSLSSSSLFDIDAKAVA